METNPASKASLLTATSRNHVTSNNEGMSRSQPFLSDGAFEGRKAVLDLGNPALELCERAGHVQ